MVVSKAKQRFKGQTTSAVPGAMLQMAGGIAIGAEHPDSDGAAIVPERPDVDGMQRQVLANRVHSLWCRVAGYSLAAYSVYSTHATIQINTCMGVSQRRRLSPRAGCSLSPAVVDLHGSADFTLLAAYI